MKRAYLLLLAFLLLVPIGAGVEPLYKAVSVDQTATTESFPKWTKSIVIVSNSGSQTCYFRLFTDIDTFAAATTASLPLLAGESLTFTLKDCAASTDLSSCKDTESAVAKATFYKSLSHICATGQTATWRVYYK